MNRSKIINNPAYKKAWNKAGAYLKDSRRMNVLVVQATAKANKQISALSGIRESLLASLRLMKAYANGLYREIPWQSLLMIVASIIYFVMPVDTIPDFILGFGLVDDAAVLGWTIKTFKSDIDKFILWEQGIEPIHRSPLSSDD